MEDYLMRVLNVILFFCIWLGIPYWLSLEFDNSEWMLCALGTWIPAGVIVIYLDD